jgi:uncharacterized hydrophobic protein (TIGR00271 family)
MDTDRRHEDGVEGRLFQRNKLRVSTEQQGAIYESILESSQIDVEYVALLALAGLIALFGLLENSAAVIIGAMLISPLMNPILSAALALLLGDGKLGRRSAGVLGISVAGVIAITWLVASLTPLKQATPEILARTAPNLLDLFIAFLSGLAGTLALRGGSVALTILPGVAIAVAVVPPLSVVGYGLSNHQGSIAGGAFLLFITNLVSIIISAAAVFRVIGFEPHRQTERGHWKLKYRVGISALVLILLSIPLFLTLRKAAIEVTLRSEVQREMKTDFETDRSSVSDLRFSRLSNGLLIQATIRTTRFVEAEAIHSVEAALRRKFGPGTKLMIYQILVTQGGVAAPQTTRTQNPILGAVVKPVEERAPFDFNGSNRESLELVQNELDTILAGAAIRREGTPEMDLIPNGPIVLRLRLISPEPLSGQVISLLASQLSTKINQPIQLHGQVEPDRSAYQMVLTPAQPHFRLTPKDRAAFVLLIKRLEQESDLRLQAMYTPGPDSTGSKDAADAARFVSELRGLLLHSRLKTTQWSIQADSGSGASLQSQGGKADPTAEAKEKTGKAVVPGPLRCDVKIFQDF